MASHWYRNCLKQHFSPLVSPFTAAVTVSTFIPGLIIDAISESEVIFAAALLETAGVNSAPSKWEVMHAVVSAAGHAAVDSAPPEHSVDLVSDLPDLTSLLQESSSSLGLARQKNFRILGD